MTARLIAIEGIDGSGKGTQSRLLVESLQTAGHRVALFSFPRYRETLFGGCIGEYLNGRFGSLAEVDPFLAALLFAGDRLESRPLLLEALATHDYVICDRYVASNVAHQGAKRDGAARAELIGRIEAVEYGIHALPRPDLTLLLDLSVPHAVRQIAAKAQRSYTAAAADLHEADTAYLAAVRTVYQQLASGPGWQRIDCERAGRVRPIAELAAATLEAISAV